MKICEENAKSVKYVGLCSICNLFWCNNCLFTEKVLWNKEEDLSKTSTKSGAASEKPKNKIYSGSNLIWSCWFAKHIFRNNLVTILKDNQIGDMKEEIDDFCKVDEKLKHLTDLQSITIQKLSKVKKDNHDKLGLLDIQVDEHKYMIKLEEAKLDKYEKDKKDKKSQLTQLNAELEEMDEELKNLQYEIKKANLENKTMAIEMDNLNITNNSYLDISSFCEVNHPHNKSTEIPYSNEELKYREKEKVGPHTFMGPNNEHDTSFRSKLKLSESIYC